MSRRVIPFGYMIMIPPISDDLACFIINLNNDGTERASLMLCRNQGLFTSHLLPFVKPYFNAIVCRVRFNVGRLWGDELTLALIFQCAFRNISAPRCQISKQGVLAKGCRYSLVLFTNCKRLNVGILRVELIGNTTRTGRFILLAHINGKRNAANRYPYCYASENRLIRGWCLHFLLVLRG